MVLFSYIQILLSNPLINIRTGSEEGCYHPFLMIFWPSHPLHIYVSLPLHILHLKKSQYIYLQLHSSLCLIFYSSFYPRCFINHIYLSHHLLSRLHIHPHIHLCPLYFTITHYFTLCIPLPHDLSSALIHPHLRPLPIFLPFSPHYYHLHHTHYYLHMNCSSQIFQW